MLIRIVNDSPRSPSRSPLLACKAQAVDQVKLFAPRRQVLSVMGRGARADARRSEQSWPEVARVEVARLRVREGARL
jgi:hypothetical protein